MQASTRLLAARKYWRGTVRTITPEAVELVVNAAIPNEMTAAVDGAAPKFDPKQLLHEVDVPAGEVVDSNKPIDLSTR